MATITIQGKLINKSGAGLANMRIEAWDKDLAIDDFVGEATSDSLGRFSITFTQSRFRELFLDRKPDLYFRIYAGGQLIRSTSDAIMWDIKGNLNDLEIVVDLDTEAPGYRDVDSTKQNNKTYHVEGQIVNSNGVPLGDYVVAAFIKSIGNEQQVGKVNTDGNGKYALSFTPDGLMSLPDIQVRIYTWQRAGQFTESEVRYNVSAKAVIDVIVPVEQIVSASEFDTVLKDIMPYLGSVKINKVREDDQHQQVSYLANKTGYDPRILAMNVGAHQIGEALGISPSHVYALFRSGVQGNMDAVRSLSPAQVRSALAIAVEKNIIPNSDGVDNTVKILESRSVDFLLNNKPMAAISTMNEMLSLRLNDGQKKTFATALQEAGDDTEKLWSGLEQKGIPKETINSLKLDGKLGYLTGQNVPLIQKMYAEFSIKNDADLVANGLYKSSAWKAIIGNNTPSGLTMDEYATHLATQVKLSYPTAVAGNMIGKKEIDLGSNAPTEELARFFNSNEAKSTIGRQPIKLWDGYKELTIPAKAAAKTFERLYQISPSDEAMIALSATGINSAYQVTKFTKKEFLKIHGKRFASPAEAEVVYIKANEVYSTSLNIATSYITQRAAPNVYALSGRAAKTADATIAYPTLEELFGNMDYCSCDHCKSVLSPAAYLVELLQFIDLPAVAADKNPINVLTSRRPDIENIQLSCENTNLALPYIDLVNEILEYYIIHGDLTGMTGHDALENTSQADLLAEPQFVEKSIYERSVSGNDLQSKVFPYTLPFHQPLATLRRLFNVWDISLEKCLAAFSAPLLSRKEALGLNEEEYKTLTDSGAYKLPLYFGEPQNNNIGQLNAAISGGKEFSRRMGLTYEQLVQLLKTGFINPGYVLVAPFQKLKISLAVLQDFYNGTVTDAELEGMIPETIDTADYGGDIKAWLQSNQQLIMGLITLTEVGSSGTECSFATVELRYALPDDSNNKMTITAYHKLHRFLRLLKKTGWSIATLDAVITTLFPGDISLITTTNIDSSFRTLIDRMANFKKLADLLGYAEKKYPELLHILNAAHELPLRHAQLSTVMKMSLADMLELSIMTGIDPLAADLEVDEPSMMRFIKLAQQLKANGLKIVDLAYLLRHEDTTGRLAPADDELLKNIRLLKEALNQVERENSSAPDNADYNFAKTKMLLVYDAISTNDFFSLLLGTKNYRQAFLTDEEGLPQTIVTTDAALGFDPFKKELTYTGILTAAAKTVLINQVNAVLVTDIKAGATATDLSTFKADIIAALEALFTQSNDDLILFGNAYPELKIIYDAVTAESDPAARVNKLITLILPELKSRLKANAIRQVLAGILKADEELVRIISSRQDVVHAVADTSENLMYDLLQLEGSLVFNQDQMYRFYVDAPATDDYILYVAGPQNTQVTLTVNDEVPINNMTIGTSHEVSNAAPVTLKAGVLQLVTLDISSLPATGVVTLSWRTRGMSKTMIPNAFICTADNTSVATATLMRALKAVQLTRLLKLTPSEVAYFAATGTNTQHFINELPVAPGISATDLSSLWEKIAALISFQGIKKENEPEEHSWLSVLMDPEFRKADGTYLLESFNGWQEPDLASVLAKLGLTRTSLSDLGNLYKVIEAMKLVTAIGYPASQSLTWVSNDPGYDDVAAIKATIKANVTGAVWLESMQSVNDVVRNNLRDALVDYILQYKRPSPEIVNPDKLYEYFLIDVEMDACMKTSRIRQALSTVQLFIQRCLMNLEPKVSPDSIRAEQWAWMKLYRVWEANRKVFLYPENWLEPELRDNKSAMFKELEGELMQQEITDESAELAFLNYLKKLDDIAKLEMVGMYLEENEAGNTNDDILHVIGRSNGHTRQHYYRRYEYGYWTPWEKIGLSIEGDHIFPVIWKKRLFVFWLSILEKPVTVDAKKTPQGMKDDPIGNNALKNVEVNMCWGEYYKGKWTSPKSTELKQPLIIPGVAEFLPAQLLLFGRKEKVEHPAGKFRERLIFDIQYGDVVKVSGRGYRGGGGTITFTSKNAPPLIEDQAHDAILMGSISQFNDRQYTRSDNQSVAYYNSISKKGKTFNVTVTQPGDSLQPEIQENILTKHAKLTNGFTILPLNHPVENQFEAPLSYADEHSTLFAIAEEKITKIRDIEVYYPVPPVVIVEPPLVIERPRPGWPPINQGPDLGDLVGNPWTGGVTGIQEHINVLLPVSGLFTLGNIAFGLNNKTMTNIR
jgi:hypothetical protein